MYAKRVFKHTEVLKPLEDRPHRDLPKWLEKKWVQATILIVLGILIVLLVRD